MRASGVPVSTRLIFNSAALAARVEAAHRDGRDAEERVVVERVGRHAVGKELRVLASVRAAVVRRRRAAARAERARGNDAYEGRRDDQARDDSCSLFHQPPSFTSPTTSPITSVVVSAGASLASLVASL